MRRLRILPQKTCSFYSAARELRAFDFFVWKLVVEGLCFCSGEFAVCCVFMSLEWREQEAMDVCIQHRSLCKYY